MKRSLLVVCALAGALLSLLVIACGGGGGGSKLTETDLFTKMIGYYNMTRNSYTNEVNTYSSSGCESLEPYNTWTIFFEDIDSDAADPDFLAADLTYTSESVRYEWSWEDSPGVVCTEYEEYVFGGQGATFNYENHRACGGTTWRQEVSGVRIGPSDTPQDAIGEAVPVAFDATVPVTLDPGDFDFFTFTLDQQSDVAASFRNFTNTLSGLGYELYFGEREIPAGGGSPDWTVTDLEARTYYLILHASGCDESGTFDLTLRQTQ